ncbi:MAG: tryptophan synthase subunit alpha [Acidimicrobiales bacterium]|nr:tryptophan synthase subunit alpha [Hyphomonadaceae bacterium]RZV43926.1 MAG: tryptophan synthase subunit alpha [Acidimicrobiales bacterium]
MTKRIDSTFSRLRSENKAGFVAYFMGGDPDYDTSLEIMKGLPKAGADIIELGMPFTDPAADGPVIELAGLRSLKSKTTLKSILKMATEFRKENNETPIIVMGYANPVHHMGYAEFAAAAKQAGIDGAIIVDLPPEEDADLRAAFDDHDLALIRLATPTTDDARLPVVVKGTKGFVYYVSVAGITGKALGASEAVANAVERIRTASGLPVVVGFGIKTPEQARSVAQDADAAVVGSAIVDAIAKTLDENGQATSTTISAPLALVRSLSAAAHEPRI